MANSSGYLVRRSNYTLYQNHKTLSSGTIYVRDYMTTNRDNWGDSKTIAYGESNFRIIPTRDTPSSRERGKSEWVQWCNASDSEELSPDVECSVWTYGSLSDTKSDESDIKIKPDFSTLRDFVYYGSCLEAIKNGINNIISTFPGELYVTDMSYEDFYGLSSAVKVVADKETDEDEEPDEIIDEEPEEDIDDETEGDTSDHELGGKDMVIVSNPFGINITSLRMPSYIRNLNNMRYFCNYFGDISAFTYNLYNLISYDNEGNEVIEDVDWKIEGKYPGECSNGRFKDGQLITKVRIKGIDEEDEDDKGFYIYQYYKDNNIVLLTDKVNAGKRIRPNEDYINKYFENLSGIEQLLLNIKSNPKYTMTIESPEETEYGVLIKYDTLTWMTDIGGWNIIVDTKKDIFRNYVNGLFDIATTYDEFYTNNLWKNMVHPSIKNMDLTYVNEKTQEDSNDFKIGLTKVEKLMYSYAIFFDDIKKHIDNLKSVNVLTYNGYNNNPDYFLSDMLDLAGWEVYSAVNGLERDAKTDEDIFPGLIHKFDTNETNIMFLRNLRLNSKSIQLKKGTREGLEEMFGLFGLRSYDFAEALSRVNGNTDSFQYDYKIDEFICVAKPREECYTRIDGTEPENEPLWTFGADEDANIEIFNSFKKTFDPAGGKLDGLPLATVYYTTIKDNEEQTRKYFVPWFNNGDEYDGGMYYQMNGGWGSMDKVILNTNTPGNSITAITADENFKIYDETVKNLIVARNVHDLRRIPLDFLRDGMIVKVNKEIKYYGDGLKVIVQEINDAFNIELPEGIEETHTFSKYYILRNKNFSDYYSNYGLNDGEYGWENIPLEDMEAETLTSDGKKVLYIENIIETSKGNNPHDGYWSYDGGREYIEYFDKIFKYSVENDNFNSNAYYCSKERTNSYEGKDPCNQCDDLLDEIECFGFDNLIDEDGNINYQLDNMKCWFFADNAKEIDNKTDGVPVYTKYNDDIVVSSGVSELHRTVESVKIDDIDLVDLTNHVGEIPTDEMNYSVDCVIPNDTAITETTRLDSEFIPFDFEDNGGENSESAANSIINTKGLRITFNLCGDEETVQERIHLYESILKYAKQMIPSGALLETVYNVQN